MTPADCVKLARLVKSLCPAQVMDEYTPDAWALVLGGIDYEDAKAAVGKVASLPLEPGRSRYIEPGHIIAEVGRMRTRRASELDADHIQPPSGLSTSEYLEWLRTTRRLALAGRLPESPKAVASPERVRELRALGTSIIDA